MSTEPTRTPRPATTVRPLSTGTMWLAGFLLLIPLVALAIVPVYAKDGPRWWGFPFFYWYQPAAILLSVIVTLVVYRRTRS